MDSLPHMWNRNTVDPPSMNPRKKPFIVNADSRNSIETMCGMAKVQTAVSNDAIAVDSKKLTRE